MKVVLAIAVLAFLAVGAYATAQFNGLPTTNQLTLTSSDKNTATGWQIVGIVNDATYNGNGAAPLKLTFNATWTGTLVDDSDAFPTAYITFGGQYAPPLAAGCDVATLLSIFRATNGISVEGAKDNYNHLVYDATTGLNPLYTAAATGATGTITLYYPPGTTVASSSFSFNVQAPLYTPPTAPTGSTPVISQWVAQPTATVNTVGANVTITGATTGAYVVAAYYLANSGNQGVAWVTSKAIVIATGTQGYIDASNWSPLTAVTGSWCGDVFYPVGSVSGIDYTANVGLTLRSVTVSNPVAVGGSQSWNGNAAVFSSGNTLTVTSGDTDNTPPACTAAAFATPLAVSTGTSATTHDLVLTCTDSGAGISYYGAYVRASAPSAGINYDYPTSTSTTSTVVAQVPAHYDGTVSVLGFWAMDGNGNTAVFGSCYGAGTICGGSGASASSAVAASISLVIALVLAVLAL